VASQVADWQLIQYSPLAMADRARQFTRQFTKSERTISTQLLRGLNACFCRAYHRLQIVRPSQLPRQGPAILVCNHISALDPVMIQASSSRLIRWMMAREYYQQKSIKWLLDLVGTIPVDRSARDVGAMRTTIEALAAGYVIGIFPEGKISKDNQILPFQSGVVLLAAKSGAPVFPAYLDGTQRGQSMLRAYFKPNHSKVAYGVPIIFTREDASRANLDQSAERIRQSVENLRNLSQNG
jgi:1-acyl-sn-glycerol-3-phosphate acyltransferase